MQNSSMSDDPSMFPINGGHEQSNGGMSFPERQQNPPYHHQNFNQQSSNMPFPPNQQQQSFNKHSFNQSPMGGPGLGPGPGQGPGQFPPGLFCLFFHINC